MDKLVAFVNLFRRGSAVADPDLWKNRAGAISAVAGLIAALVQIARLYGYELPIDEDGILAVAGGLVTLVCMFLAWGTSKNTGVLPAKRETPDDSASRGPDVPPTLN